MALTREEIEAKATPAGGYTRKQLAQWSVPWPPPKGWKERLIAGEVFDGAQFTPSPIRPNTLAHDLLRDVVLAIIDKGHASDLYEFPDVLAYFGSEMPGDAAAFGPIDSEPQTLGDWLDAHGAKE